MGSGYLHHLSPIPPLLRSRLSTLDLVWTNSGSIVFIHGLTGDSYQTWLHERSNTYWPVHLLSKDIHRARIFKFGYDADVVNFWNPASQNRISNHAENLLGALVRYRERTDTV